MEQKDNRHPTATVAFATLGCKVNQYDTQAMREILEADGFVEVPFSEQADVYIVNTCTVTATGDQKSRQMIGRARQQNPEALLVVAGCYAQRSAEQAAALPGVGLVLGTQDRTRIAELVREALEDRRQVHIAVEYLEDRELFFEPLQISQSHEHTRANLKIQEGCRQFCTYCIIPYVRGPLRSRPVEEAVQEADRLVRAGHKEIVLTGIHLTSYGLEEGRSEFKGERLLELLYKLDEIRGLERIRMGSVEPQLLHERFIDGLRTVHRLCPHWHVSLQSGSSQVLKRMKRTYGPKEYLAALDLLRASFPQVAITTDVMCGFPGETQQDHEQSMAFVEQAAFSRIHVFTYSPREGTPAARMENQIPYSEKKRRTRDMLAVGKKLETLYIESKIGKTVQVLFEEYCPGLNGIAEGYTPDYVRVRAFGACPGQIAQVRIHSHDEEILTGKIMPV